MYSTASVCEQVFCWYIVLTLRYIFRRFPWIFCRYSSLVPPQQLFPFFPVPRWNKPHYDPVNTCRRQSIHKLAYVPYVLNLFWSYKFSAEPSVSQPGGHDLSSLDADGVAGDTSSIHWLHVVRFNHVALWFIARCHTSPTLWRLYPVISNLI